MIFVMFNPEKICIWRIYERLSSEVCLNYIVEKNDFFVFPQVKWLHLTDEANTSVSCLCHIFSGLNVPKIIKISWFLTELFSYGAGIPHGTEKQGDTFALIDIRYVCFSVSNVLCAGFHVVQWVYATVYTWPVHGCTVWFSPARLPGHLRHAASQGVCLLQDHNR